MNEQQSNPGDGEFRAPDPQKLQEALVVPEPKQERPPLRKSVEHMRLYHGSAAEDIEELAHAEEDTIGQGVYLTSMSEPAAQYAERRAQNRGGQPTLYEADIDGVVLADLTDPENVRQVMRGFRDVLISELQRDDLKWFRRANIEHAIETIDNDTVGVGIRTAAYNVQDLFSQYLQSLGFDGLIGIEGGESNVKPHDSYVIFEPAKVKLVGEHSLGKGIN